VKENDVRLFNPANHVGRELKDAGYTTSMIGKYFNWAERLSATQWQAHADGLTDLPGIPATASPAAGANHNGDLPQPALA
jgi:hypothetical protein